MLLAVIAKAPACMTKSLVSFAMEMALCRLHVIDAVDLGRSSLKELGISHIKHIC
jgi:hypothetical protein